MGNAFAQDPGQVAESTVSALVQAPAAPAPNLYPPLRPGGPALGPVSGSVSCSARVQANFLLCAICGVEKFRELQLSRGDLTSLAVSVGVSCASLGYSFAGRDKKDCRILGLPGKLGLDERLLALELVRVLEIASRICAINILHVSLRGTRRCAGPATFLVLIAAARALFPCAGAPEASRAACVR